MVSANGASFEAPDKKDPASQRGQVCGASRSDGHGVILVVAVAFCRVVDLRVLGAGPDRRQGVEHIIGHGRQQVRGAADKLASYEAHIDQKLERMLSMLLKLKDLRREADAA